MNVDGNNHEVRKRYIEKFKVEFQGKYSHMYVLVGSSPEPIIRNISSIDPKRICFICTPEVEKFIDIIVQDTGILPSMFHKELVDGSNPGESYRIIKKYLRGLWKGISPQYIVLDISGGKKSMVGGACIAASYYGIDIIYSDFTEFDHNTRRPVPGTEYLAQLENPFERTLDVKVDIAKQLFNARKFKQSKYLFNEIRKEVTDPMLEKRLDFFIALSQFYDHWWNLDFLNTNQYIGYIEQLSRFPVHDSLDWGRLRQQMRIVTELQSAWGSFKGIERVRGSEPIRHLVGTIIATTFKNEDDGEYTECALKYYRLCELVAQHRLTSEYNISTSSVNWEEIDSAVVEKFQNALFQIYSKSQELGTIRSPQDIKTKSKIGLMDAYGLLVALDDPVITNIDINELQSKLSFRNDSYLAHGLNSVNEKGVRGMKGITLEIIRNLYRQMGIPGDISLECEGYTPVTI